MTSLARPVGGFSKLDADGFIIPSRPCSSHWQSWAPAVKLATDWYVERYGKRLHSVYVRGSVATGTAEASYADLDMIGLLHHFEPFDEYLIWRHVDWEEEFASFATDILPPNARPDFAIASLNRGFLERNNALPMVLATQGVCVHGTNVIQYLPRYKPGIETMYYNGRMQLNLAIFYNQISSGLAADQLTLECKRVLKSMLRCAGELEMDRDGKYSRDLYFCCLAFEGRFPQESVLAWSALECYLEKEPDLLRVLDFAESLGHWLARRERIVDLVHRPNKLLRWMHDFRLRRGGTLAEPAYE